MALDPHADIFDDTVLEVHNLPAHNVQGPTSFGGFWLALHNKYASTSHMRFVGAVGYEVRTTGNLATQHAVVNGSRSADDSSVAIGQSCDLFFRDPMTKLLSGARNLMFRTSLAAVNSTTPSQSIMSQQSEQRDVFRTSFAYLGGAVGITILALLMAAARFRGYRVLGWAVTMGPVEVAKAFDAPLLRGVDSNAQIKSLTASVGSRRVMYGVGVGTDGGSPPASSAEEIIMHEPGEYDAPRQKGAFLRTKETTSMMVGLAEGATGRLMMGPVDDVRQPRKGEVFDG